MKRKVIFFNMDNVLVDLNSALYSESIKEQLPKYERVENGVKKTHYEDIPEIFAYIKPVEGAVEALKTISQKYEVYILSNASWANPIAWSDKLEWVKKYFDSDSPDGIFYKRLVLSQNRDMSKFTDAYLVDGHPHRSDSYKEGGKLIYLNKADGDFRDWSSVVDHLMKEAV